MSTPLSPPPPPTSKFPRWQKVLAILLVGGGLLMLGLYGFRFVRQAIQFRTQGLRPGVSEVEEMRPWMTLQYVAVAYGVPTPYLADALDVPDTPRNRDTPLGRLAREQRLEGPAFMAQVEAAIRAYEENPVATGIEEIRPWMTLEYVANAAGVPVSYLLTELGLPLDQNWEYQPLRDVGHEVRERELGERLLALLAAYEPAIEDAD